MNKKYIVRLTTEEREKLEAMVKKGKAPAYQIKHANILLAVDAGELAWTDEQVARAFRCHLNTVCNVRQRFVEQGLEAALKRKQQETPSRKRILDGEKEAKLIAVACSKPPRGQAKWTLKMLADQLVQMEVVDSISPDTVQRALKKTSSSRTCANVG